MPVIRAPIAQERVRHGRHDIGHQGEVRRRDAFVAAEAVPRVADAIIRETAARIQDEQATGQGQDFPGVAGGHPVGFGLLGEDGVEVRLRFGRWGEFPGSRRGCGWADGFVKVCRGGESNGFDFVLLSVQVCGLAV